MLKGDGATLVSCPLFTFDSRRKEGWGRAPALSNFTRRFEEAGKEEGDGEGMLKEDRLALPFDGPLPFPSLSFPFSSRERVVYVYPSLSPHEITTHVLFK